MKKQYCRTGSITIIFGLFLITAARPCFADTLVGEWKGRGAFISQTLPGTIPVDMSVSINLSETKLEIRDCWKNVDFHMNQCYSSSYDVDDNGKIYDNGQPIGDIYPGQIVIFIGKSQVAEQMIFDFGQNALRYQYVFVSFDGISKVRRGVLER